MNRNELRIGNRIFWDEQEMVFSPLMFEDIDRAKPISLTEEWLLKFGCELRSVNRFPDGKLVSYVSLDKINPETDYGSGFELKGDDSNELFLCDCDGGRIGKHIQYVHQLQNLYFALTGEELEIKE